MKINDLDVAINAAISASEIIAESYGNFKQLDFKSDIDVVTEVDFKCEEAISKILREETPDYGIIAEEGTSFPGEKVWIVDPLDGTTNFAAGIPYWSISIARFVGGLPETAFLDIPALIIPLAQSAQGIPHVRYIVQPFVDTPILAAL